MTVHSLARRVSNSTVIWSWGFNFLRLASGVLLLPLLLRLLSAPGYDVFGVGDDDQVIYGHAGADPRFLIDYRGYFPCAREHALEVNYRCPAPVVDAARSLLAYNVRRVDKQIRSAPDAEVDPSALRISVHAPDRGAGALVEVVREWLAAQA